MKTFNTRTRLLLKVATSMITVLVLFMTPGTTPTVMGQAAAFEVTKTSDGTSLVFVKDDGSVGLGTTNPNSRLEAAGIIHSTTGGFKFPDGSVQTTSSTGGGVPLGTVIDWWQFGSMPVPDGFALCDGSTITDAASPFNGQPTPNLVDRFIYGTATLGDISDNAGGSETVNLSHSHGAGSHTHSGTTGPSNNDFSLSNSNSNKEGVPDFHTHNFTTGPASGSTSSALGIVPILPPHARLLKIIRIR